MRNAPFLARAVNNQSDEEKIGGGRGSERERLEREGLKALFLAYETYRFHSARTFP